MGRESAPFPPGSISRRKRSADKEPDATRSQENSTDEKMEPIAVCDKLSKDGQLAASASEADAFRASGMSIPTMLCDE